MSERQKQNEGKVMRWIKANFDIDQITVDDFPLFPSGKRIIDREGGQMVVFYDFMYDRVDYRFPDKEESK